MVDKNEAPEGYFAVGCFGYFGCDGCAFKYTPLDYCLSAECEASRRKDGHYVIFVKKPDDGRATANFPCDDMGTPV